MTAPDQDLQRLLAERTECFRLVDKACAEGDGDTAFAASNRKTGLEQRIAAAVPALLAEREALAEAALDLVKKIVVFDNCGDLFLEAEPLDAFNTMWDAAEKLEPLARALLSKHAKPEAL